MTHTWEVCMIFDTLPWSNVVPTRSYFTNKWINEKFKNWSMNSRSSHIFDPVEVQHWSQTFYKSWTNHQKKLQSHGHLKSSWYQSILQVLKCRAWNLRSNEVNSELQWKEVLQNLKWNMNHQPSHKEVKNQRSLEEVLGEVHNHSSWS